MIRKVIILLPLVLSMFYYGNTLKAQYIEQVPEITAGNFFGVGARQMAMGGAGMLAYDGNAMFYNPANLARIPRIEVNVGFSLQDYSNEANVRGQRRIVDYSGVVAEEEVFSSRFAGFTPVRGNASATKSDSRFNDIVLVIPYPTYRGSLVFAFGAARVANFDRTFRMAHSDSASPGNRVMAIGDEYQSGGLTQWGAAMGIDISPRISFGLGAYVYTGTHEYDWEYSLDSLPDLEYRLEDFITDEYSGWNLKASLSYRMNRYLAMGLAIESPLKLSVEEEFTSIVNGSESIYPVVEYEVKRPYVLSGGMTVRYSEATLALEADYTDWSQLEYDGNRNMELFNDDIQRYYSSALRLRLGGEYVIPSLGLSLRGGVFRDPLPFKEQFINDNRTGYSAGFGLLIDQVLIIDLAWVHGNYNRNSDYIYSSVYNVENELLQTHNLIIDESISYDRIYVTSAYRF